MNRFPHRQLSGRRGVSAIATIWLLVFVVVGVAFLWAGYSGDAHRPISSAGAAPITAQPVAASSAGMGVRYMKHIEDVKAGDRVWAYDTATGTWAAKRVIRPLVHEYRGDLVTIEVENQTIRATGNHPFWVLRGERLFERPQAADVFPEDRASAIHSGKGRWIEARRLEAGDVVVLRDRAPAPISAVFISDTRQKVYNLQVADLHTYAVSALGVAVHNKPCFLGATRVLMADGSTKPIKDVQLGDQVLAEDPLSTGPALPHEVIGLIRDFAASLVRVTIAAPSGGRSEIFPTPYHPFWTRNRGWVEAKGLWPGDLLVNECGVSLPVTDVTIRHTGLVRTYNLTIASIHTYFVTAADGTHLLVHNGFIGLPSNAEMQAVVDGLAADPLNPGIGIYHVPSGQTFMSPAGSLNKPYGGGHLDLADELMLSDEQIAQSYGFLVNGSPGNLSLENSSSLNGDSFKMPDSDFNALEQELLSELNKIDPRSSE